MRRFTPPSRSRSSRGLLSRGIKHLNYSCSCRPPPRALDLKSPRRTFKGQPNRQFFGQAVSALMLDFQRRPAKTRRIQARNEIQAPSARILQNHWILGNPRIGQSWNQFTSESFPGNLHPPDSSPREYNHFFHMEQKRCGQANRTLSFEVLTVSGRTTAAFAAGLTNSYASLINVAVSF